MEIFNRSKYKFSNVPSLVEVSDEINRVRANEIALMEKELYSYRIFIQDLFASIPNEYEKNLILNIAFYIIEEIELLHFVQNKKKLPINILSKKTKQSKKFIDDWSEYIIAYFVIFSNPNYRLIQDYMKIEQNEEKVESVKKKQRNKNVVKSISEEKDINEDEKDKAKVIPINKNSKQKLRGIVLKVFKHSACILTSTGEFRKIKLEEGLSVGREVLASSKKRLSDYKFYFAILIVVIIISLGSFLHKYSKVDTIILINTTSQVRVEVNSFNKIINVNSSTTKGTELVNNLNLNDMKVDEGVEQILSYADKHDMIPDGKMLVTVTGKPLVYGSLDKTSKFVKSHKINLIINNAGNEQNLSN